MQQNISETHEVVLDWGHWHRAVSENVGADGVILNFTKREPGAETLQVTVEPPATVTFGTGIGENGIDINDGWVKR